MPAPSRILSGGIFLRKLSIALALAFLATSFTFVAAPASADNHMMGHRCGRGMHWVHKYRDRRGTWIPGHCVRDVR